MAYDDLLKIRTWSVDGSKTEHITEKVQAKTWSGSYRDCARQLSFSVLPEALAELGDRRGCTLGRISSSPGTSSPGAGTAWERRLTAPPWTTGCT